MALFKGGANKEKKKGKGKAMFYAFIFTVLILLAHYMYFESKKLEACGANVFADWRSYVAYVLSKVPYVNSKIKYTPMKIGNPSAYYKEILSGVVEDLGKKMESLEKKEQLLKAQESKYRKLIQTLSSMKDEWQKKFEELNSTSKVYENVEKSVEDLKNILKSGDPEELSTILVQKNMSTTTIAAAVKELPDDLKAEILQALAKKDPIKAAEVTDLLGSIEEKMKEITDEQKKLKKLLDEISKEKAELENEKAFVNVITQYISNLNSRDIVKLVMDLKLNIDTIAAIVSRIPSDKSQEVLSILQNEYPSVFKGLVEKGVGE